MGLAPSVTVKRAEHGPRSAEMDGTSAAKAKLEVSAKISDNFSIVSFCNMARITSTSPRLRRSYLPRRSLEPLDSCRRPRPCLDGRHRSRRLFGRPGRRLCRLVHDLSGLWSRRL